MKNLNLLDLNKRYEVWLKWTEYRLDTTRFYKIKERKKLKMFRGLVASAIDKNNRSIRERLDIGETLSIKAQTSYAEGLVQGNPKQLDKIKLTFDYRKELQDLYNDFLELDMIKNQIDEIFELKNYLFRYIPSQIIKLINGLYKLGDAYIRHFFKKLKNYIITKLENLTNYIKYNIRPEYYLDKLEEEKDKLLYDIGRKFEENEEETKEEIADDTIVENEIKENEEKTEEKV